MDHIQRYIDTYSEVDLVNAVIDRIESQLGQIGLTEGIMAGQAVASALYEVLGTPLRGQYNDIDVFVPGDNIERAFEGAVGINWIDDCPLDNRMTVQVNDPNMVSLIVRNENISSYANVSTSAYLIKETGYAKHNPNINLIACAFFKVATSPADLAEALLSGFDLNCVMCGINLATKKLYYTPSFNQFLHDRQLRVQETSTPAHTTIRLGQKLTAIKGVDPVSIEHEIHKMLEILLFSHHLGKVKAYKADGVLFGQRYFQTKHDCFTHLCTLHPIFSAHFQSVRLPKTDIAEDALYTLKPHSKYLNQTLDNTDNNDNAGSIAIDPVFAWLLCENKPDQTPMFYGSAESYLGMCATLLKAKYHAAKKERAKYQFIQRIHRLIEKRYQYQYDANMLIELYNLILLSQTVFYAQNIADNQILQCLAILEAHYSELFTVYQYQRHEHLEHLKYLEHNDQSPLTPQHTASKHTNVTCIHTLFRIARAFRMIERIEMELIAVCSQAVIHSDSILFSRNNRVYEGVDTVILYRSIVNADKDGIQHCADYFAYNAQQTVDLHPAYVAVAERINNEQIAGVAPGKITLVNERTHLRRLGKEEHHCVGGLFGTIQQGALIYIIEGFGAQRRAVGLLHFNTNWGWRDELRTFANGQPELVHQRIRDDIKQTLSRLPEFTRNEGSKLMIVDCPNRVIPF